MQTYVVQRGDTLYGISKQFGVSVEEIKAENNLSSDFLTVGRVLLIPTVETTSLYVVKRGDTLYSIASKYNVSVSEIIDINDLSSTVLNIGQQLRIPINSSGSDNTNYVSYTVKSGDTLYSIARKYNVRVNEIRDINNLSNNMFSRPSSGFSISVKKTVLSIISQLVYYVFIYSRKIKLIINATYFIILFLLLAITSKALFKHLPICRFPIFCYSRISCKVKHTFRKI